MLTNYVQCNGARGRERCCTFISQEQTNKKKPESAIFTYVWFGYSGDINLLPVNL